MVSLRSRTLSHASAALFLLFGTASCGGGGGNSPTTSPPLAVTPSTPASGSAPPPTILVNEVVVPQAPDRVANATVLGVDSNSNGVRDDVERVIGAKFGIKPNGVLLDLAKSYQDFLALPTTGVPALKAQLQTLLKKEDCIKTSVSDPAAAKWVKYSVLNTNIREAAFNDRADLVTLDQLNTSCGS